MVRETITDFSKAIETENFSEIYERSSSFFQASYTEEEMKAAFSSFIRQKKRVVPILKNAATRQPEFTTEPFIRTEKGNNILVANGKYTTRPLPTSFELEYVFRSGQWKLLKLIVRIQ